MIPPSRAWRGSVEERATFNLSTKSVCDPKLFIETLIISGKVSSFIIRCISLALIKPSRIVAKSLGPPRCNVKRDKALSRSGQFLNIFRKFSRSVRSDEKNSTASNRLLIFSGSVRGADNLVANVLAPLPVSVRSIVDNKLPFRSPFKH